MTGLSFSPRFLLLRDPCWIDRYRWAADHGATFVALAQYMLERLVSLGLPRQHGANIDARGQGGTQTAAEAGQVPGRDPGRKEH